MRRSQGLFWAAAIGLVAACASVAAAERGQPETTVLKYLKWQKGRFMGRLTMIVLATPRKGGRIV